MKPTLIHTTTKVPDQFLTEITEQTSHMLN